MPNMCRFTLSQLLITVAIIAYCLGMCIILGWILGEFFVTLMLCYVLISHISIRSRAICAGCCSFLSLLPWLGLGQGVFFYPGAYDSLPSISLPSVLEVPLSWIYFVAETPLYLVAEYNYRFREDIFFNSPLGIMRRFAFFVFWLGFALVFGLSIGSSWYAKRRRQSETKQTT